MTTIEQARDFALALPETEERAHMGKTDFRVRGRIFATFPREGRIGLRLDPAAQAAALATEPAAFEPAAGAWGRQGWTIASLELLAPQELRELIEEAWCWRAPKRLVEAYASNSS